MSSKVKIGEPLYNKFKVPTWAGKPPSGLHLDVLKDDKLIQKLMIDEKSCYFFGRNSQLCDFPIDHESASRVHAALVWHKHLNRPFLVDCNSVHGTFVGRVRLEPEKPQQIPPEAEIHFGASTRRFIIRERPTGGTLGEAFKFVSDESNASNGLKSLLSAASTSRHQRQHNTLLPETEAELENLTEFNTAHNRRLASMTGIIDFQPQIANKRRDRNVTFNEVEDIINPEDVDNNVGRFRNLVKETFIPNSAKKARLELDSGGFNYYGDSLHSNAGGGGKEPHSPLKGGRSRSPPPMSASGLGSNADHLGGSGLHAQSGSYLGQHFSVAAKLGLPFPNLAPDVEEATVEEEAPPPHVALLHHNAPHADKGGVAGGDDKKKYAKEAWPGKRPGGFLVGPAM